METRRPSHRLSQRKHRGLADMEARTHHLASSTRRGDCGVGAVLETYEGGDLGADRLPAELDRFLRASIKEEIRLDLHRG